MKSAKQIFFEQRQRRAKLQKLSDFEFWEECGKLQIGKAADYKFKWTPAPPFQVPCPQTIIRQHQGAVEKQIGGYVPVHYDFKFMPAPRVKGNMSRTGYAFCYLAKAAPWIAFASLTLFIIWSLK